MFSSAKRNTDNRRVVTDDELQSLCLVVQDVIQSLYITSDRILHGSGHNGEWNPK